MRQRGPHIPIFNPGKQRGNISPGAMLRSVPIVPISQAIRPARETDTAGALGTGFDPTSLEVVTVLHDTSLGAFLVSGTGQVKLVEADNLVYAVTDTTQRLTIIDVSNPALPVIVGIHHDAVNLLGSTGLDVDGIYAYVVSGNADTLTVINVSNPALPTHVGVVTDASALDSPTCVKKVGNYCFVTCLASDRFSVVNVSNPAGPFVAAAITSTNLDGALGFDIVGNYAYIACLNADRFTVVDISNPLSPFIAASITDGDGQLNGANAVTVDGSYAFVTSRLDDRVLAIDISNPTSPWIAGSVQDTTLLNGAYGITKRGWYCYVTCGFDPEHAAIINVNDPLTPRYVGGVADAFSLEAVNFHDSDARGEYHYAHTFGGLAVLRAVE